MASKSQPLAFSTVGTTLGNFFAIITGATTVSGLFLGLFGLTAFSNILVHDNNITMFTVLSALSQLPNPLDFIRDITQIVNAMGDAISRISMAYASTNNIIIDMLVNAVTMLLKIASYFFMLLVSLVLLPFYLIYFFVRCGAVALSAIGFNFTGFNILKLDWKPVETIIEIIRSFGR